MWRTSLRTFLRMAGKCGPWFFNTSRDIGLNILPKKQKEKK